MPDSKFRNRKVQRQKSIRQRGNADRISNLPDTVLSHILSYLPTENAVATSILSRRWKHVWTSIQTLSFDDRTCLRPRTGTKVPQPRFMRHVDTVLHRTHPANVLKLAVHCSRPIDLSRFNSWVSSALVRSVRELQLFLEEHNHVKLPAEIYRSTSLEVLKLQSAFHISDPSDGPCFPSVRILSVRLHSPKNTLTENLFCRCPSLEELTIEADLNRASHTTNFVISSPTLKRFTLWISALEESLFNEVDHTVTITASILEYMKITADTFGYYVMHELHSLTEVILDIFFGEWAQVDPNRAIQLLAGLTATKHLTVSNGVVYALDKAYETFFPSFAALTYLELTVGPTGWRVLPVMLNSSDNLESFILQNQCWFDFDEDQFGWIERDFMPRCLRESVKKIEVRGVEGDEEEMQLLEYLLKSASMMETMTIRIKGSIAGGDRITIRQTILQLQRASKTSTIEII